MMTLSWSFVEVYCCFSIQGEFKGPVKILCYVMLGKPFKEVPPPPLIFLSSFCTEIPINTAHISNLHLCTLWFMATHNKHGEAVRQEVGWNSLQQTVSWDHTMMTSEFSGFSLFFRFRKASPSCSVFVHTVRKYISTSFEVSVLLCLSSLTAIPFLQFLHGWQSTVSATVTSLNVEVKASVMYLLCTDGEKKLFSEIRKQ